MTVGLLLVAAYLVGSLPTSRLAGRRAGVEPRDGEGGDPDVSSGLGIPGWRRALPVVVADVAKGFAPVWFFPSWDGRTESWLALAFGLCVIAGHVRSIFVGFEASTGVATTGGVLLALTPLSVGVALLVWVGIAALTRSVPAASLTAASLVPIVAWIADASGGTVAFTAVLACLVWWTHRDDVERLLHGREAPSGGDRRGGASTGTEPSTGAEEGG